MKLEVGKRYKNGRGEMTTIGGIVERSIPFIWSLNEHNYVGAFVWGVNGHWYEKDTGKFINVTRLAPYSLDVVYTPVDGWRALCEEVIPRPLEPRDMRPRKDAWAPGKYLNTCPVCGERFLGDKRAYECAPCAYDDGK